MSVLNTKYLEVVGMFVVLVTAVSPPTPSLLAFTGTGLLDHLRHKNITVGGGGGIASPSPIPRPTPAGTRGGYTASS